MAKGNEFEAENAAAGGDEDEATLAAIDEGLRDAKTGSAILIEEVRKLLPQWITASSSRNEPRQLRGNHRPHRRGRPRSRFAFSGILCWTTWTC